MRQRIKSIEGFTLCGRTDPAEGTLSVSEALRVSPIRTLVAAKPGEPNRELIDAVVRDHRARFRSTDFIF